MKRIAFIISVLAISSTQARAQQGFFVFIQSEKQQPFYVRVNEKSYSSSAIGYLVIPSLGDSSYNVNIGFPRNQYPEQHFAVTMAGKDRGYLLKQAEGQGWSLFDEEAQQSLVPRQDAERTVMLGERKTGAFVTLMSSLVNDSAVMYRSIVKADLPKPAAPVIVAAKPDSMAKDQQLAITPVSDEKGVTLSPDSAKGELAAKQAESAKGELTAKQEDSARAVQVLAGSNEGTPASVTTHPATAGGVDSVRAGEPGPVITKATDPVGTATTGDSLLAVHSNESARASDTAQKKDSGSIKRTSGSTIVQLEEQTSATAKKWLYIDSVGSAHDTIDVSIAFEVPPVIKDSLQVKTDTAIVTTTKAEQVVVVVKPDTISNTHKDSVLAKEEAAGKEGVTPLVINADTGTKQTTLPVVKKDATPLRSDSTKTEVSKTVNEVKGESSVAGTGAVSKTDTATGTKKPLVLMNSDCVNFASETDVDKLRIKVLTANGVEDKINVVKKAFKAKCYATKDIRALSELFANDESKFAFFDAAYPYVSDTGNFKQLLSLLTDDLYVARFKTLVRM